MTPSADDLAVFRGIRESSRAANGGGGMCHEVSDWIEAERDWERRAGTLLSPDGEVCASGHFWNVLPDGSILDCTADQLGEGHDVLVVAPGDPAHGRWDEERSAEWHPGLPEWNPASRGMRDGIAWDGESDDAAMERLVAARGHHWWATDPAQLERYLRDQIAHAEAHAARYGSSGYLGWVRTVLSDVQARARGESPWIARSLRPS